MDRKQWFTSQENGLEEFNHFYSSKNKMLGIELKVLYSVFAI